MKYKKDSIIGYIGQLIFCFGYRFIVDGMNMEFHDNITSFTVNTVGYMDYIHTATFYSLIYVFILGRMIMPLNTQNLVRISRDDIEIFNNKKSLECSLLFSIFFCIPQLMFMIAYFEIDELAKINFFIVFIIQLVAYFAYFLLTSQILMHIYYNIQNVMYSEIIVFIINSLLMFLFRIAKIKTSIDLVIVCTKYYSYGLSIKSIIISNMFFIPVMFVLFWANKVEIRMKDVI